MHANRTEPLRVTLTRGTAHPGLVIGPRLHVTVLDYLPNAGVVAAGWHADAGEALAAITLAVEEGPAVDLLRQTALPLSRDLFDAFDIPQGVEATRAFMLFLPGRLCQWAGSLPLDIRHRGGAVEHCLVPATGHFSEVGRIIELAPIDQALQLAERLLAHWDGSPGAALPPMIDSWIGRLHQRLGRCPGGRGAIDEVLRIETKGMLVRGRLPASAVEGTATVALVGFGGRRELLETPLPALDECSAFAVFAAIPGLRPDERFWFLEVGEPGGRIERIPFHCPPAPPPLRGIEAALALLEPPPRDAERVLEQAVAPAADGFWHAARHPPPVATVATYGCVADAPPVSVVVPLDGPIERMRHQIVQFSNDSEFRSGTTVELIYVVDDISVTEELRRLCQSLNGTYGVPFRIVTLDRRSDRAGSRNAGAKAARGSVLLFLCADVLPKRSRWVGQLLHSYRALEHCGVLGCRLLFEDGSIRHGGITFRASASLPGLWEDHDPRIGLPNQLEPLGDALRIPAVSGACLLVDRALFDQLGGFAEEYVSGDFADYDLCLAAQQRGWRVYCTAEVELYQLGLATAASAAQWREQLTRYNRWKHSRKWRSLIPMVLAAAEA